MAGLAPVKKWPCFGVPVHSHISTCPACTREAKMSSPVAQEHQELSDAASARAAYFALSEPAPTPHSLAAARPYLERQLQACAALPSDLPDDIGEIAAWITQRGQLIGEQYQDYLRQ